MKRIARPYIGWLPPVEAQSSLALLSGTGTEIDEDQNEALRWYLKAQLQQINRIDGYLRNEDPLRVH